MNQFESADPTRDDVDREYQTPTVEDVELAGGMAETQPGVSSVGIPG